MNPDHPKSKNRLLSPARSLFEMFEGTARTQLLYLAAFLGLADLIGDSEASVADLAKQCGVDVSSLARIMKALSSLGVFKESSPSTFVATPMSRLLRQDHPSSVRPLALYYGSSWRNLAWLELPDAVQSGQAPFQLAHGLPLFEFLGRNSEESSAFSDAMRALTRIDGTVICQSFDFSDLKVVVDVGGGNGLLLTEILRVAPHLEGWLFEMPTVAAEAQGHFDAMGLQDRTTVVTGNFFEALPPGGDLYILKRILHDWDDEEALKILQRCRQAVHGKATLLIAETVLPDVNAEVSQTLADMEMLVMTPGGRERTLAEFNDLLTRAGFQIKKIHQTPAFLTLIEVGADPRVRPWEGLKVEELKSWKGWKS